MTNAKLTPAMSRAVEMLDRDGCVSVGDYITVGTIVALMHRGILREAKGRYGRHYPATTPAQVYAEAWVEHGLRICDEIDAEAEPIKVGDLVQRVNEQGPDAPTGKVLEVRDWPIVGILVKVTFEGTAATQKQAGELVKVEMAPSWSRFAAPVPETPAEHAIRDAHTSKRGDICLRKDGEHSTHGYARYGQGCDEITDKRRAPLTPTEDRTGASDVQASIADEVAALRREIHETVIPREDDRDLFRARLDRIAALVPQRATDDGDPLWLAPNGTVLARSTPLLPGSRALYTVAGR